MLSSAMERGPRKITVAHSPDADDAFMFYGWTQRQIDTGGLDAEHLLVDIETLNRAAFEGRFEVTALSFHAYAYLQDRYLLMPAGASFGDGYGPIVVARRPLTREGLGGRRVAIPGELTTAALVVRLWQPGIVPVVVPFDRILTAVGSGEVEAGVVIHEGQLTFAQRGLEAVVDLGAWWKQETGCPLPLGGNGVRRDLERELRQRLCRLLIESIDYGLAHRSEALEYARRFARELEGDLERSDRFVQMYVNDWTRGYGPAALQALDTLYERAYRTGFLPRRVKPEFEGDAKTSSTLADATA